MKRILFPPPDAPLNVARKLYEKHRHDDTMTLRFWRGSWLRWQKTHWSEVDISALRSVVYRTLGNADYMQDLDRKPWNPNRHKVSDVIDAMSAVGNLSADIDPDAGKIISFRNGLLNLSTRKLGDHTPKLFNLVSVPFDYNANAPQPTAWLRFLESLWPDDPESIALLQEYFGYVLSGRTDLQKMLVMIGPTRSGKGTIARVLRQLIGGNCAGPTLAGLGTNFGLQSLLGKPLAIISDARLGDAPAHTVVERLLSITGEDALDVDRKHQSIWSGKLPTRFMILSNELPKFKDASAAIVHRMVLLQMTKSFLGNENLELDGELLKELSGILLWSLDGLDRLKASGRFTMPKSSINSTDLLLDVASPVASFIRERCIYDPVAYVSVDELYSAWKVWAEENGHHPGSKPTFGRNLFAAESSLESCQRTLGGKRTRCYSGVRLVHG